MRRLIPIPFALMTTAIAGCSGSSRALSHAQAEAQVRSLERSQCHLQIRHVRCTDQGDSWMCTFSASKEAALIAGGMKLDKHSHGNVTTVTC